MTEIPFLRPRLIGPRFENRAIPLEVLKDLAVIEEMVIEVAKWKFLCAHPERRRSPRRFTEGIELKLTGVEEGSAVPVISLFLASSLLFPPDSQHYFEEAREAIVGAIGAAEQNKAIGAHLPDKALSYFDRIGRSLRDGEAMEFTTPLQPAPARLTRETRRKLVFAPASTVSLTEETAIRGLIPEADQDDKTFEIQLVDGRKIKAPLEPQTLEAVLEAFIGYKNGSRVLVQGVGNFSRGANLQSFESVEHVTLLDPLDVPARLDQLRILKDGWLNGKGTAPSLGGLDWLSQAFSEHFPDDLRLPYLYPVAEGGVQAEWSLPPFEITLEIDLAGRKGEWHELELKTEAEEQRDLPLDKPDGWKWLADRLRRIPGGTA
ncbi:MAG: hypothetical protein ABJC13_11965 [Acidobacteriota bacterium]